jgi:hypothetical protein
MRVDVKNILKPLHSASCIPGKSVVKSADPIRHKKIKSQYEKMCSSFTKICRKELTIKNKTKKIFFGASRLGNEIRKSVKNINERTFKKEYF